MAPTEVPSMTSHDSEEFGGELYHDIIARMERSWGIWRDALKRVDAGSDPRPLGRLASSIALTLMGKHKPIYDPSTDCGDYVVCTGLSQLHTTGKKMQKKKYYSHTTRPGSLKEITMERMMEKWGGGEILRRAVRGMLPKNRLRDDRMARLKCKFFLESGGVIC